MSVIVVFLRPLGLRLERTDLVGRGGASRHGRKVRNLEQAGSLERDQPSSASVKR